MKTQQDSSTITMIYDLAGRMIARQYGEPDSSPAAPEAFTYNYAVDKNVLSEVQAAGNFLTDNRGNSYTRDIDNRIVKAEGSYTDIEYRYDALGRRIVRKQGTEKEVLLWWGNTEQSEHKHQAGQETIQNDLQANPSEQALNTVFARALEGSKFEIEYFHKNYLDHVMAVANDNGNIIEQYRYTAFGEPEIYSSTGSRITTTAIDNDILWNVRRYESATGLYMYLYRDYDAATGRWPSRDPIQEMGGIILYGFVNNDGVNAWDFLGFEEGCTCEDDIGKLKNLAFELTTNTTTGQSYTFSDPANVVKDFLNAKARDETVPEPLRSRNLTKRSMHGKRN